MFISIQPFFCETVVLCLGDRIGDVLITIIFHSVMAPARIIYCALLSRPIRFRTLRIRCVAATSLNNSINQKQITIESRWFRTRLLCMSEKSQSCQANSKGNANQIRCIMSAYEHTTCYSSLFSLLYIGFTWSGSTFVHMPLKRNG